MLFPITNERDFNIVQLTLVHLMSTLIMHAYGLKSKWMLITPCEDSVGEFMSLFLVSYF